MSVTVRDNPEANRFEVFDGDDLAGFAEYRLHDQVIDFTHTEVDDAFAGRGLAGRLVGAALDEVRGRGLAVRPYCPYVNKFIAKHEEYLDLVAAGDRAEFKLPAAGEGAQ
ncbi:GNAT family N-acetyltransferase [Spirillospora sp. NPDC047279]|uniref:GNAT family N-acetyltransferase n=1 Tax=Spirillospora sp. NPDC047279 TaxID=3155478 RepID=UPI0033D6563C